ncbi:F-box-like domain protein [Rhizoctonia solani AG-3 Rhs1AP]|uniref:F-box-like domain protein n=1 Tax=Rhizoctonia solani AG-3 Rhs1AP TaxID=1086054 RepID=X8J0A8_9AGAM|nr:F-box-like domain protein [Rhizoctonia solani AG-3 Rhs1AP]
MVSFKLKKTKEKLNKTKAATLAKEIQINVAITAINLLPAEVLAYIFQCLLLSHSQSCFVAEGGQEGGKTLRPPDYPDSLLRVCSHWHQVALATPTLWSHIDIFLPLSTSRKTLPRAKAFLKRSGQYPLDIHIFDEPKRPWRIYDKPDDEYSNLEAYLMNVLRQFFGGCSPGTLTKLTSRGEDFLPFIDPMATRSSSHVLLPPIEKLEAVWLSITTLHISDATCLPWSSNAFKGLIDLRLGALPNPISESEFVNILKSSPGLRILQFHLRVTGALPLNTLVEPIHLNDLEVLDLIEKSLDGPGLETLIRWIDLGQKSLRLSLWCPISAESLQSFFRRSNVTEFHCRIDGSNDINIAQLEMILRLSPGLRVLAIDGCDNRFLSRNAVYGIEDSSCSPIQIDTLHLQYCQSIQLDKLHWMIKKYSIQKLMMWSSTILNGCHAAMESDITSLCPVAKRLKRREFTPMEDWIESIV